MGRFSKLETGIGQEPESRQSKDLLDGVKAQTFPDLMAAAHGHFYASRFRDALRLYSRALQLDSSSPDPWVGQILALAMQSNCGDAMVWAKRSLGLFPENATLIAFHGLALCLQGMTKRGLATSDYAMSLNSSDPYCWIARGWILLEADNANWSNCFSHVDDMPEGCAWQIQMLMGMILQRKRKWARAQGRYQAAAENRPDHPHLWVRLGQCYEKLGLTRKALEAAQHALELDPKLSEAEKLLRRQNPLSIGRIGARLLYLFSRKAS